MNSKYIHTAIMSAAFSAALFPIASHAAINLGGAGQYAVLAGSTVTNTGPTTVTGSVGVSPGSAVTGFPPGSVTGGFITSADSVTAAAQADLSKAYAAAAALVPSQMLTGQNLGGMTLQPGTYSFATSAQLNGILTLDYLGDPNAQFVFQIGSTLTTASLSSVISTNGGSASGDSVFWQVGSSATLGTGTSFEGNIMAYQSITLGTGAIIDLGSALAINGAVTLDTNRLVALAAVPEPEISALYLAGTGLIGFIGLKKRRRQRYCAIASAANHAAACA